MMKIETYLSALIVADRRRMISPHKYYPNSTRQYLAFRDGIIRRVEEKDERIRILESLLIAERGLGMSLEEYFYGTEP